MAKKEKQYRSFIGIVQFEPRESETSNGTEVRNIVIRATGGGDQSIRVSATLWPSHAHVEVDEGDVVVIEGSFTRNKGENSDGESVTYNNLSVSKILVLGTADEGERDDDDEDEKPKRNTTKKKSSTTRKKKAAEPEESDDDPDDDNDDDIPF